LGNLLLKTEKFLNLVNEFPVRWQQSWETLIHGVKGAQAGMFQVVSAVGEPASAWKIFPLLTVEAAGMVRGTH